MKTIRIHPSDNVCVALDGPSAGHKFALKDLKAGESVVKYGYPIGRLTRDVTEGGLIDHTCLKTGLDGILEYSYTPVFTEGAPSGTAVEAGGETFNGFVRADGQVGIRNQIWIIPTVGCVNGIAQTLAERFRREIDGRCGTVDAVVAFPHNYGCSQLGGDHENTKAILADLVHHPNAGGVLVVSLGCENNQLDAFLEKVGPVDGRRVRSMTTQKIDGDEIEFGLGLLREIFEECSGDVRTAVPASKLRVGLKCGGSDGLSGITANPMLGRFSDWLTARGGTTVLTEVPEMFGAETILMNRCASHDLFEKTVALINNFKQYFIDNGQPIYENPSPGNKAGGISTLEEKSLGCTQKSGTGPVRGVLRYGERLCVSGAPGLNLLSAPGNDLVASTALAASGCQMVLFTTGRGTPFGSPVPTMKISTNTPLSLSKPHWIDFNAGRTVSDRTNEGWANADCTNAGCTNAGCTNAGGLKLSNPDSVDSSFKDFVISVANGELVNHEKNNTRDLAIFKSGVTL